MHEIMFALGDLPKIIFKVHFVAGPTLKKTRVARMLRK